MNIHLFAHRTFLRGVGMSMALPWLESRNIWGEEHPASDVPIRLCVTFSGNGVHSKESWAKGEGSKMELGRVLQPLAEIRSKMLFVLGRYHEEARKGNIHSSQTDNMPPAPSSTTPTADGTRRHAIGRDGVCTVRLASRRPG